LRQLVTSKCLSSFLPVERYTRPRLPSSGSLGPHSPTFTVNLIRLLVDTRYYAWLRLPLAHLGDLHSSLVHRYLVCPFRSCPFFKLAGAQRRLHQRLACLVTRYAISGLLTRKQMALPSSQTIPLNACPALGPRWCPAHSPYRAQDCCLPLA